MRYLLFIPLIPASVFSTAWLFMLAVGVVHGEWLPMMPTVGYWSSVLIVLMVTAVVALHAVFNAVASAITGSDS